MDRIMECYDDITKLCYHLARGGELWEDLRQEVLLELYQIPKERLDKIECVKKYAARIIYLSWLSPRMLKGGYYNKKSFYFKYKYFSDRSIDSGNGIFDFLVENYRREEEESNTPESFYNDIMTSEEITAFEKDVLREYVRRNCKVSQYAKDAGVDRIQLKKRIEEILEKCKNL